MKKAALALCILFTLTLFPIAAAYAENTASVPKGTPVIDGKADDPIWNYAETVKLEHITIDSPKKDENHATATAKLLWDEGHIYCLVDVKDKAVSDAGDEWRQDSVEYFIDALNLKGYSYKGANNAQYRLGVTGLVSGGGAYDESYFKKNAKVARTSDGYLEEVAIPLASHGIKGKEGMKVGFDFQVNDDSNNDGDRDYILTWNEDGDAYENPSQMGTITLAPAKEGAPAAAPAEPDDSSAADKGTVGQKPAADTPPKGNMTVKGKKVTVNLATSVSTFENLGLYWNPGMAGQEKLTCKVQYRVKGAKAWKDAMDLWYDARTTSHEPPEFRGSIVGLVSGTNYEVKLSLSNGGSITVNARTMSENFPIGQTVYLPANSKDSLSITSGGKPGAYKLYTFDPKNKSAVIDVDNKADTDITVSASYVIIRGLTLKGAARHGINLIHGAHHVIIEGCDISGWGTPRDTSKNWGNDLNAGIHGAYHDATISDIVVQRNKIHNPRTTANSWDYGHPAGPQGIAFEQDGASHQIIRYNEVYGDDTHFFNDCIGGADNYSQYGFPGKDSDVYGNLVSNAYDDALEIEGGGMNVRVYGNYIDKTATGVSSACASLGPLYIYRNVYNTSRMRYEIPLDKDERGGFGKAGDDKSNPVNGGGRRYYFHNTTLQAPPPAGSKMTLGAAEGIYDSGGDLTNTVSRNNIWQVCIFYSNSINDNKYSKTNNFDYDLFNGRIDAYAGAETHGIHSTPLYAAGNGWASGSGGKYALAPKSPGYHAAVKIPNFNDMFAAPDMGAQQSGTAPMQFGVKAYLKTSKK